MKITRFIQSCLLIETKGKKILIDPGNILFEESLLTEYRNDIDILLVTHKHSDHCHVPAILAIVDNPKTKFYTTSEVAHAYKEIVPNIVFI
ncbi:MAG: MBL fold metallo-hydrolase [bacterium]